MQDFAHMGLYSHALRLLVLNPRLGKLSEGKECLLLLLLLHAPYIVHCS